MTAKAQSNKEQIIEIHGELKLIKHDIQAIKENHLTHLDYKITQMQKVLWVVFTGVFGNVLWVIKTVLMG
jgi:L-lactate utilization protein LutB